MARKPVSPSTPKATQKTAVAAGRTANFTTDAASVVRMPPRMAAGSMAAPTHRSPIGRDACPSERNRRAAVTREGEDAQHVRDRHDDGVAHGREHQALGAEQPARRRETDVVV